MNLLSFIPPNSVPGDFDVSFQNETFCFVYLLNSQESIFVLTLDLTVPQITNSSMLDLLKVNQFVADGMSWFTELVAITYVSGG
jgi:hypothetical protein